MQDAKAAEVECPRRFFFQSNPYLFMSSLFCRRFT